MNLFSFQNMIDPSVTRGLAPRNRKLLLKCLEGSRSSELVCRRVLINARPSDGGAGHNVNTLELHLSPVSRSFVTSSYKF
jgi:hypothetical protein